MRRARGVRATEVVSPRPQNPRPQIAGDELYNQAADQQAELDEDAERYPADAGCPDATRAWSEGHRGRYAPPP